MKANQKYFPLLDSHGKLTHKFLIVSNISPADPSAVIQGNERVVRPRLADAKFFFDQDRKKTLESRLPGLGKVVYHGKLGTQGERAERVRAIAHAIVNQWSLATLPFTVDDEDPFQAARPQGAAGGAAGQDRPADRHGRRVPGAAGDHGRLLRAP